MRQIFERSRYSARISTLPNRYYEKEWGTLLNVCYLLATVTFWLNISGATLSKSMKINVEDADHATPRAIDTDGRRN